MLKKFTYALLLLPFLSLGKLPEEFGSHPRVHFASTNLKDAQLFIQSYFSGFIMIEGILGNFNQSQSRFSQMKSFSTFCIPRANIYYDAIFADKFKAHMALNFIGSSFTCACCYQSYCGYGAQNDEGAFRRFMRPIDEVTLTWIDPRKTYLYSTIGIKYIPFGFYERHTIPASFTKLLTQTQAMVFEMGYFNPNGFNASLFTFKGKSSSSYNKGMQIGYQWHIKANNHIKFSFDWLYDINNSVNYLSASRDIFLKKASGICITLLNQFTKYDALAQFMSSLNSFDVGDQNHHAKPKAFTLEIGYKPYWKNIFNRFALSFQRSFDAQFIGSSGLPKYRLHGQWTFEPLQNIKIGFHIVWDKDYPLPIGTNRNSYTGLLTFAASLA